MSVALLDLIAITSPQAVLATVLMALFAIPLPFIGEPDHV